jgi:hypothetical protein
MPKGRPSTIRDEGNIAYVELTRGYEATIDKRDIPLVQGYSWRAHILRKGHVYAARTGDEPRTVVLMHRHLMGAPADVLVDHEDGDGLNNRRGNMRIATPSQNNMNMSVSSRNLLGIKGVSQQRGGKFSARIERGTQRVYLGSFRTPEEASAAYFGAARILFGDFAKK